MTSTRMAPALAKRFRSGRPSLDFAHTASRVEWIEPELIIDTAELERWLGHVLALDDVRATAEDLPSARRLRDAVWGLAQARIHGRPFTAEDVTTVNEIAAAAPPVPSLTVAGTPAHADVTAAAALSALARDAIDLLTGPLAHRIRGCAADGCALMFVDASRPGTRRWCSMERCGNLAKVRTHRGTPQVSGGGEIRPAR